MQIGLQKGAMVAIGTCAGSGTAHKKLILQANGRTIMDAISRRDLLKNTLKVSAAGVLHSSLGKAASPRKLADIGWVWEGQSIDGDTFPSIYGVGEGAEFFRLKKVVYMYHPNNELGMEKLRKFDEVICDISKWKFRGSVGDYSAALYHDMKLSTVLEEAKKVAHLSLTYHNLTGAFHDDLFGQLKEQAITAEQYSPVYNTLKTTNPRLKLWTVFYSTELGDTSLINNFKSFMDVITFWVYNVKDLPDLDRHVAHCRELFPDKPIILGCYLWDYPTETPMPLSAIKFQWERLVKYVAAGTVVGYHILGASLLDSTQDQARWVRDFIAAN